MFNPFRKTLKKPLNQSFLLLEGAILGNILGSPFEGRKGPINLRSNYLIPGTFTDDTLLIVATMEAILENPEEPNFTKFYQKWVQAYEKIGFGPKFYLWANSLNPTPYLSDGNGAPIRCLPIAFTSKDAEKICSATEKNVKLSHKGEDATKYAIAASLGILNCRLKRKKQKIARMISTFTNTSIQRPKPQERMISICRPTFEVVLSVLSHAKDFEDAILLTIKIGGDTDTNCTLVGAFGQFFWEIPSEWKRLVEKTIPTEAYEILQRFNEKYKTKPIF